MEMKNNPDKPFLLAGKFCPECSEEINPEDLEMFPRCPFCNHLFQDENQLEDFVLRPVLQRWVSHKCQQFFR